MQDVLSYFIGEWIDELQDGFMHGMSDVVVFYRENLKTMLLTAGGPEMGGMISSMGTETAMQYVQKGYKRYKELKERAKA